MLTHQMTEEQLEQWKRLFDLYAASMLPNRKTGEELDDYFRSKYQYQILESKRWESVVKANIMDNECFREKVPQGIPLKIKSYSVGNVMVGIDLLSGYFQVESEETEKMVPIYDDLFVYRGLDATDLKNFALVGQYLEMTQR